MTREKMETQHTPGPWNVGDAVIWRRARSNWSRIGTEIVHGIVIEILPRKVRIKLVSNIKNSLTALVDPAKLEKGV